MEMCTVNRLLQHGSYLGRDRNKMSLSRISRVLRGSVISEEPLPFVETLFRLFGEHRLGSFVRLLWEVLGKDEFDGENTEAKPTFVRIVYGLGGYFPSLDD